MSSTPTDEWKKTATAGPMFAALAPKRYRIRYYVANSCTATSLKHEVEQYLLDGWQLQGGVSVAPVNGAPTERHIFAQALVKLEKVAGE